MNLQLNSHLARERRRELIAAANHRRNSTPLGERLRGPIVVRIATARDRAWLENLAALDSTEPPTGTTLIGELRDRPVAALSLSDRKVIADPFVATSCIRRTAAAKSTTAQPHPAVATAAATHPPVGFVSAAA